jgi:class 3 adenylate cyclase/DNA-binding CsgD family transcriptional regulator
MTPEGLVALLFTDLVGSTELPDRLGDDAGEELRRTHFSLLREAVTTSGGEEVKNLEDGLMVAFPSAVQAAACAVAMQRNVAEHNRSGAAPVLRVRIGLHAGEPFREEGDFFGTAVAVAKRLCDQAKGGQILASELVARLVGSRGGFRLRPADRLSVKGLANPLPAVAIDWEPQATAPAGEAWTTALRPRRARTPRGPRLVGRGRELEVLEAELAQVVEGEFRCVLLLGDPGLGKTRLAEEVLARHSPQAIALSARAHPLGGTTSFGLWAEALEGHLRALDARDVSELCGGFLDDLAALLRSAAAARGSPPQGEPPRSRLLEGLAVVLANLAEVAPLLVFLDDVHMADPSSWDALHYLARNLSECRVLVLATARPAELHGQTGPTQILLALEQDGRLHRLEIEPLATEAVDALARVVLGHAPLPALVAWLDERSRGNPLFALGLIKALQDEGADLAAPRLRRLPEALAERVIARLGALDEPARSTLEVLAVVGRRVELGSVVALTGRPLDRVGPLLDGLVRSRLVTEEERGREVIYEIAHPLIQETIYEDLGAARRHALHRLVARSLLASGRLGEAAPHFARSAEVGDPEAIEALREAVRQAEERQLYREALTILGALVDLLPPGDERWLEILDVLGSRAEWVVDHRADAYAALGIPALRFIDSILTAAPDPARRATVKFRLTSFLAWGTGELEEAQRAGQEAQALFERAGDTQGMLLAALELSFIKNLRGDPAGWVAAARQVAESAEAADERLPTMIGRAWEGTGSFFCGRFDEAESGLRRAIAIAGPDEKVHFHALCFALLATSLALEGRVEEAFPVLQEGKVVNPDWREGNLGEWEIVAHWLAGDFDSALSRARESIAWNTAGMSRRRAHGMVFATLAGAEAGRVVEARRYLDVARSAYGGKPWGLWMDYCSFAEAVLARQRAESDLALTTLGRTAERTLGMGYLPFTAFVLVDLAEVAAESRDAQVVTEAAAQLDGVAARVDRDLYRGLAAVGTAWAHLTSSASPAAEAAEEAVRLLSPLGYPCFLGRALDVLGRSLAPLDRARAREVLGRAVATFDACGATWRREGALRALRRLGEAGKRAAAALGPSVLTAREAEVARLAVQGETAAEIGQALFIGERTVESHLARVYAKLGVTSKYELVQRACELGLADPTEPVGS